MSTAERLRLIVITDTDAGAPRSVFDTVSAALAGGCRCIQVRDKRASSRDLLSLVAALRGPTTSHGALLIVNDRFDVALAADADGVHLGPDDLPVAAVRAHVPADFVIGASTDVPERAKELESAGADYIGCGTVYQTASKADAGAAIGLDGLRRVVRAVSIPVVGIGGITPDRVTPVLSTGATGVAVIGAVMGAADPLHATQVLLDP